MVPSLSIPKCQSSPDEMCVRVFDAFDATITIEMDYLAITIQWMDGWDLGTEKLG